MKSIPCRYLIGSFFVVFIFFQNISLNSIAQTPEITVKFSYDENGNRVKRWIPELKIVLTDSTDSLCQDSLIKNDILNLKKINETITLYPNPTQGLLDLKITGMKEGEAAEYVVISLMGQVLLKQSTGIMITRIDISDFIPGTYFINVTIRNRNETWKIIKH